jgi:uncharacterized membrane protein
MSDTPVELVVAAFTDEQGAERALEALKQAKKEKLIHIQDAAVITCDTNNKVHIKETADMRGGKGAGIGALVGGAVGLIFPPAFLASAAVGAAVGGLGAKLHDAGFRDERLKELGASLKPGTSAIVAVIEHVWVDEIEQELAAQGAQMVREAIKEDIAKQLDAGQNVAYVALADDDEIAVARVVDEPTVGASTQEPASQA